MDYERVKDVFKRKRAIELLKLLESEGELNFKSISDQIESSSDTISSTLALLGDLNLVTRKQHSVNDVRYSLTDIGSKALEKIEELRELIEAGKSQ